MVQLVQAAKRPYYRALGFTLIEMMMVICLIAITATWAVPSLKKAYEDFCLDESFYHLDTFVTSFKSFYLIENEFPEDSDIGKVRSDYAWCLPSHFYTRNLKNSAYQLNIKPYQATSYDINNWLLYKDYKQFYISIYQPPNAQIWHNRLLEKYTSCTMDYSADKHSACLGFFPGLSCYISDQEDFQNTFY